MAVHIPSGIETGHLQSVSHVPLYFVRTVKGRLQKSTEALGGGDWLGVHD